MLALDRACSALTIGNAYVFHRRVANDSVDLKLKTVRKCVLGIAVSNTWMWLADRRPLQKWRRSHTRYNDRVTNPEIEQVAAADFPTRWGKFRIYGFRRHSKADGDRRVEEAVVLVMGDVTSRPPLVRVHSQCLTGDVFHSLRCDCRQQLELSLSMIGEEAAGILIYEQQEGRGIGLMAKLQAYELQDAGLDTV